MPDKSFYCPISHKGFVIFLLALTDPGFTFKLSCFNHIVLFVIELNFLLILLSDEGVVSLDCSESFSCKTFLPCPSYCSVNLFIYKTNITYEAKSSVWFLVASNINIPGMLLACTINKALSPDVCAFYVLVSKLGIPLCEMFCSLFSDQWGFLNTWKHIILTCIWDDERGEDDMTFFYIHETCGDLVSLNRVMQIGSYIDWFVMAGGIHK